MSENDNEDVTSPNDTTEEVVNTDEVEEEVADTDSEDLEALREKNKRLFERTKKAEAEAKLLKAERIKKEEQAKVEPKSEKQDFDLEDVAVLVQKVAVKEDRQLVKDYAKFKGISLEAALNEPIVQTALKDSEDKRLSANATNTGTSRRGSSKPSPEQILEMAEAGKEITDFDALADARMAAKKNNK